MMGRAVLNWLVILFQKSKLRVKEKHKQNLKSVLKFSSCGSVSLIFSFLTLAFYDHLSFPVWFTALYKSDTHLKVQNKSCKMETLETMYHHNDFLRDIPPPLHASKLVSHILQDYLRLSRFRALINQNHCHPASTSNQCPLAPLPGKPGPWTT